ncbi:Myotubularin- protein 14 [Entomortierella beljakovae]|nr:Myotubularin- protein 14 [Entomortierella beljakovae]
MDQSLIEDADQSFDLSESGMMSFQDIRTELESIHPFNDQPQKSSLPTDQDWSKRNLLPFAFRIPRPEKRAINEFMTSSPSSDNLKSQEQSHSKVDKEKVNDTLELSRQFEKSHFARVRARFVVPCILVRGKNICRSATLSSEVEVIMHNVNQKISDFNQKRKYLFYGTGEKSPDKEDRESSLEKQRLEDIELLQKLGVTYINDLMVENRKVKYGLKVTSSEKVDSFGRYSNFNLVATPYPGVEFFRKFKANKYSARSLCFDWTQNFADAELQLPPGHTDNLGIRWRDYKNWDLIELTQNYLRLYLTHIADDTIDKDLFENSSSMDSTPALSPKGLLIHCISGWDRTPLFISLLRISLWADGEIHQSLTAAEILYLTMGYDWFLFKCDNYFIYREEFSLNSVANLSKSGKTTHRPSFSTQPVSVQSPLLKDIGRLRGSEYGTSAGSDVDEAHGYVCEECKALRKSSSDSFGRSINAAKNGNQDVASSTDGKPSSWQLVTFASSTPPGREKHGSPRAPIIPTLQAASRQSNSPLSAVGNSYSSESMEQGKLSQSSLKQQVLRTDDRASSPLISTDKRFNISIQQFNTRRSSSSGIPSLFAGESRRLAQGPSGLEVSRVATSPNLVGAGDTEIDSNNCEANKEDPADRQTTPRKRASTFDGGLLLSFGPESSADAEDIDPKGQEDDLTSGEDDIGDEEHSLNTSKSASGYQPPLLKSTPNKGSPQLCQICHHSFTVGSKKPSIQDSQLEGSFTPSRRHTPVGARALEISQQSMATSVYHPNTQDVERLFSQDEAEQTCRHDKFLSEFDRDEGMFQLEIEDRPTQYSRNSNSQVECLGSTCLSDSRYKAATLESNPCLSRALGGERGMSPAVNETSSFEGDENESFWDETSTFDYGCSPGSILNDFGLESSQLSKNQLTSVDSNRNVDRQRRMNESVRDEDDEEDDDDDDGGASVSSRPGSLKMGHNDGDRLFMPSLIGVFPDTVRTSQARGERKESSILGNSFPAENFPETFAANTTAEESSWNKDQNQKAEPKTLTRRQKLRQLRRLFMNIQIEIGEGDRLPTQSHLDAMGRNMTSTTTYAEEGDSGGSFRAESFSDDNGFQYRSPTSETSAYGGRQGANSTTSFKLHSYDQRNTREPPTGSRGDSFMGSTVIGALYSQPQQKQERQQRQSNRSVQPPGGRKSPFEWAAAAATIVSGGFSSHSNSPSINSGQSTSLNPSLDHTQQKCNSPSGSNHYRRPFALPPAQSSSHQPQHCRKANHQAAGSNNNTTVEEYQDISSSPSGMLRMPSEKRSFGDSGVNSGYDGSRRRSLASLSTTTSASNPRLRGTTENPGRWDW